ncbi:cytochrome C oxidase assembly protein [Fulvimarina pelagi HTCC2506]|uniref:Cytochrome c oxidase assembly protein CtaG n=3 Tax=Fulvimarina pelagi TaxID=217511 RepID=Q0FXE9_9HYPH|nr:cytochrome c oxidase assembly protein [Fulvimarina pelagi]EAU39650.1 cytochrome C oxidase assembly protein [Fulvimarina pelagi HTCC2506]BAT30774.1 cytochrome C oxidase assembly protein [Fulvimarina pelagi]
MDNETSTRKQDEKARRRGLIIAASCTAFIFGMVGAAYASVPLYELFCQVTGYGGTTQRAEANELQVSDKTIEVRFDGNTAKGLPWTFRPNDRSITVRLGETSETSYQVVNNSDRPITGQALYNVTPDAAGIYFNKIACFCFNEQTLQPGESVEMPITFFVDPEVLDAEELQGGYAITLSYTFFPVDDPDEVVNAAQSESSDLAEGAL